MTNLRPGFFALGLLAAGCSNTTMMLAPLDFSGANSDGGGQIDLAPVLGDGPPASSDLSGDQGPVITFLAPTAPTAHGTVMIDFTVTDANSPPVASSVKAGIKVLGEVTLTQIGSNPMRFTGTIDFTKYVPPLTGTVLIQATATSQGGVVGTGGIKVTVDNAGPTITFVNPTAGQFVGGVQNIRVNITDESVVDDATVVALVGGAQSMLPPVQLKRTAANMPEFSGLFDFHALGTKYVLPTLSVHAEDTFHNATDVSEEIVVDNAPPVASLDPPLLRVAKFSSPAWQCSHLFDPVGSDAADDGFAYPQVITLRARIEDQGNQAFGLDVVRFSDVDQTPGTQAVSLMVLPTATSTSQLLVDTDKDGQCDDVNPLLVPVTMISGTNQVLQLTLAPMALGGAADFTLDNSEPTVSKICDVYSDGSTTPPVALCAAAFGNFIGPPPMTFVLPYAVVPEPAIWTLPPVTADPAGCAGLQFDSSNVPEGPACVAVRATDRAGNIGVSPPLRVCICHGAAGSCTACNNWPTSGTTPFASLPNCGGIYDKATNTVAAGSTCTPAVSTFIGTLTESGHEVHRLQ